MNERNERMERDFMVDTIDPVMLNALFPSGLLDAKAGADSQNSNQGGESSDSNSSTTEAATTE